MDMEQGDNTEHESRRLEALNSYEVLDTLPEKEFDAITRLASYICQTPLAFITFIDGKRQWFKSRMGFDLESTPLSDSFCKHTMVAKHLVEVPDARENELYGETSFVKGDLGIRFYAGAPLIDPDGYCIGTLCVFDKKPRHLSAEQRDAMLTLADEVMSHLILRKQKKELEKSLSLHREFSNLFNSSSEIHFIAGADSKIETINNSISDILGYTPDEALGKSLWDFVAGKNRELHGTLIEEALKSQKPFEIETETVTRTGKVKHISWTAINRADKWYASGRDTTSQQKTEKELTMLSLVASKTTSGVVINNSAGKVEWVNAAFEQITGYSLSDVRDKHLGDSLKGELTDVSIIQKSRELSENKQSFEVDLLIYRKDGQPLWISVINSVIIGDDGKVDKYIETIIDITAKKKVEFELVAAKEEALQLSRAKDIFIGVMSHEIRTPLNAVIGMSHLLLEDNPLESQKENLSILKFSAENLMTLINDVLDFTKIETGNVELEKARVDISEMIHSIVGSMRYKAQEKNISLTHSIDEAVPTVVLGDRARLVQILLNLVSNGVKFTNQGGVTINLKVIEQNEATVRIRFEVTDTGIGIAKEKQGTIFESFKQAEADTTRNYGGTGLGLAISKRLIELHDSRVNVDSVLGEGSTFWFTITFTKVGGYAVSKKSMVETGLDINVLVVDDNQINRLLINKVLKRWGATADFAENGQEAIDKLTLYKNFDVVLMDIHMPIMGGLEATGLIRSQSDDYYQKVPIIALTASMMSNQMGEIEAAGMNDYILKPFDPTTLFDKLSRYQKQ
jgi:PAS domain S-box-containing protein